MMPTFRQQLVKRRTLIGAITLLCLLWHILLPTLVHVGVVPALFFMPVHCQPTVLSHNQVGTVVPANSQLLWLDHSMPDGSKHQQMSIAVATSAPTAEGPAVTPVSDAFHTQHAHEVFALAAKIMKHCPLCSHGLDAGVLIPLIALLFILLAQWFAVIRSLGYKRIKRLSIPQISFALPFKHGPPVIL